MTKGSITFTTYKSTNKMEWPCNIYKIPLTENSLCIHITPLHQREEKAKKAILKKKV